MLFSWISEPARRFGRGVGVPRPDIPILPCCITAPLVADASRYERDVACFEMLHLPIGCGQRDVSLEKYHQLGVFGTFELWGRVWPGFPHTRGRTVGALVVPKCLRLAVGRQGLAELFTRRILPLKSVDDFSNFPGRVASSPHPGVR
jgi:hypothetical protein